MLSIIEKSELKSAAVHIRGLPELLQEWRENRQNLTHQNAANIEKFWPLLGISLDAFFSDESNPIPLLNLGSEVEKLIQKENTKYVSLALLLFQAEKFIRQEASNQGVDLAKVKRSDFLKRWATEHCLCEILLYSQSCWEGYSHNQWEERKRECVRHARGEISPKKWELLTERWAKEDSKLALGDPPPEDQMPFTKFCLNIFKKYGEELPEFAHFVELWYDEDFPLKIFIINGEVRESKRRKRS